MADVVNTIPGKLTGLSLATDLTTPVYRDVVCGMTAELSGGRSTTTVDTRCGIYKSYATASFQITGSGAANTTPGGTEFSVDDLLGFFQNKTKLAVKMFYIANEGLYSRKAVGVITQYRETGRVKELVLFDFQIEIEGDIT